MGIEFNSIEELYKRVKPALTSKTREFRRNGKEYIKEEDIWNYLVEYKWKSSRGLELFNIVDDILNINNSDVEDYVINKMKDFKRSVNLERIDLT